MARPRTGPIWLPPGVFSQKPNLSRLIALYESNYRLLLQLAPALRSMAGDYRSRTREPVDLHLQIEEQTRYTSLLRLTYLFEQNGRPTADPDARLRAYHDSVSLEVISLRQTTLPLPRHPQHSPLPDKWRANLFINKWLTYCVEQQRLLL